jgi:hypothetical protein
MQTSDPLLVECYAWFPEPGDAKPNVMVRAEYDVGYTMRPNGERLDRMHSITLEVIHRPGEFPVVQFDEEWPVDLAIEIKAKIISEALCGYLGDCGLPPESIAIVHDLVYKRLNS